MINRKLVTLLSFRYKILALVLIVLAGGLLLLPKQTKHEGISPQYLLSNMISPERYISPDELAHKIINNDPSFILIDVRDELRFQKYSLPNAINIPIDKLLDEGSLAYLDQDQYDVIFYSNDHFYADQAWMVCNRLEFKNHHVLKGGVNLWFSTIINPQKPEENKPASYFDQYSFRKAASMHFGVQYPEDIVIDQPKKKVVPKKVVPIKKKKKLPVEGGC